VENYFSFDIYFVRIEEGRETRFCRAIAGNGRFGLPDKHNVNMNNMIILICVIANV